MKMLHLLHTLSIIVLVLACVVNGQEDEREHERKKKTIVLFGISGVGKSTVSNCLLGAKGDMNSIQNGDFPVSEDAASGNTDFEIHSNDKYTIVDTIGFGSADINGTYLLKMMRRGLHKVNNELDLVVFVIRQGRLTNDTFQFIRTFQENVLRNESRMNSLLLVNRCERGWLARDAQRNNPFIRQMLASVNNVSYEFDLKWDHWSDDAEAREHNVIIRQRAIDDLIAFIDSLSMTHITVDHIHTDEFERHWLNGVFSLLHTLANKLLGVIAGGGEANVHEKDGHQHILHRFASFLVNRVKSMLPKDKDNNIDNETLAKLLLSSSE